MHKLLKKPSPATVIACLALFVASTGTSIAASHYLITSTKQIKPSVIAKLKGNAGPQGPAGATGAAGAAGAKGATNVVKRTAAGGFGLSYSHVIAYCLPGETATGGGADWDSATTTGWPMVSYSVPYPYNTVTPPTGWETEIDNMLSSGGVVAKAWVLCAS